jgi:hypothetical protein
MNKKRLSLKKTVFIILISLLGFYILQSLYLTLRISVLKNNKFKDVPYKESSFISEELYNDLATSPCDYGYSREDFKQIEIDYYISGFQYTKLFFNKAVYSGRFKSQFRAIKKDGEDLHFGDAPELYVELEFINFRWVVTRVYESV